ncbi:hypothetical protein N7540_002388 [Penicillium herquei]|nr:hypothetical protein N7540_002388 [Penicillium herquei]
MELNETSLNLSEAVAKESVIASYTADYAQTILDRQDWLNNAAIKDSNNPQTWIKVHRKHLLPETLLAYNLPWDWDEMDRNYLIIKTWVSEEVQEELFKHTQNLREKALVRVGINYEKIVKDSE